MDLTALAIRLIVCPRCEAALRAPCTTISGRRATHPHSSRTEPVYAAWRIGYGEALEESAQTVERLAASNVDATAQGAAHVLRLRLEPR
jgi:hypothetical protein